LKAGLWFRRGRLVMVSPVSGIYAKVRQKFHLSPLFKFPEPALFQRFTAAFPFAASLHRGFLWQHAGIRFQKATILNRYQCALDR